VPVPRQRLAEEQGADHRRQRQGNRAAERWSASNGHGMSNGNCYEHNRIKSLKRFFYERSGVRRQGEHCFLAIIALSVNKDHSGRRDSMPSPRLLERNSAVSFGILSEPATPAVALPAQGTSRPGM